MASELVLLNIKQILFYNVRPVFIFRGLTGYKSTTEEQKWCGDCKIRPFLFVIFFMDHFNSNYYISYKYVNNDGLIFLFSFAVLFDGSTIQQFIGEFKQNE